MAIDDATMGGGQHHLLWLAERLEKKRFTVSVICEGKGYLVDELERRGISVHALSMSNRLSVGTLVHCVKLLRSIRPDILHTHGGTAGFVGRFSALFVPVKGIVHTYHGIHYLHEGQNVFKRLRRLADRILLSRTDRVICVAETDYQRGLMCGVVPSEKSTVIRNGIDVKKFATASAGRKPRTGSLRIIGTIGRLHEQKGHRYFLAAAAKIRQRFPGALFRIIGDGDLREELNMRISELGLGDCVQLLGLRTDIPELLASMDIFALPSLWEGLPLVLLEAMAAGIPIASTNVDGVSEIIRHERDGLLVSPKDPDALAAAICRLMEDTQYAADLAKSAHERVRQEFDIERMVRSTESVYENVLLSTR